MDRQDFLLDELCVGNRDAFNVVFRKYYGKVSNFIDAIIKDTQAAEDIAQDIFVKLWTRHASLTGVRSLDSYIYMMARNAAIDHIRKDRNFAIPDEIRDTYGNCETEELYFASEKELIIKLVLAGMPEKRRKIFEMNRYSGLSNEEIAKKLSVSKKTIENQITLALKELRQAILLISAFCLMN